MNKLIWPAAFILGLLVILNFDGGGRRVNGVYEFSAIDYSDWVDKNVYVDHNSCFFIIGNIEVNDLDECNPLFLKKTFDNGKYYISVSKPSTTGDYVVYDSFFGDMKVYNEKDALYYILSPLRFVVDLFK